MNTKPISPKEIVREIHPEIIRVVNNFLTQRYSKGNEVKITLKEIKDQVSLILGKEVIGELFKEKQFDIEASYEDEGWIVEFDKPGFNENWYEPFFIFKAK